MNQAGYHKCGIILTAVWPGERDRQTLLPLITAEVKQCFAGCVVTWAFTGPRAGRCDIARACAELTGGQAGSIVVQPFFCLQGTEYNELALSVAQEARNLGISLPTMGLPLLAKGEDPADLARLIREHCLRQARPDETVVWIGHGSTGSQEADFQRLFNTVRQGAGAPVLTGSLLHADRDAARVIEDLERQGAKRVLLLPFLAFSGHHSLADMGGCQPGSWKSLLENQGFTCRALADGLAAVPLFRERWLERLAEAVPAAGQADSARN